MQIVVVVGNPKPQSRTLQAATHLVRQIDGEPSLIIDLATIGTKLLEFGQEDISRLIEAVQRADLCVFACPTYKASFTGLLKLFLDQFPPRALRGIVAVPMMMGAGRDHALAPELHLKPVLSELGAFCLGGLYVLENSFMEDERIATYASHARAVADALKGIR
jgi:FMN reductase